MSEKLLQLDEVIVNHRTDSTGPFGLWGAKPVRAVDGVTLTIHKGETIGLMGGSGAGKTTLAEAATLRRQVDRGRILLEGEDVKRLDRKRARRRLQMVRQDARETLDMDKSVRKQMNEALREFQLPDGEARMTRALTQVGLDPEVFLERAPKQMSGGQQQRVAIARALALNPVLLTLDEPVSGVDPRLQEEILRLLGQVQKQQGTAYLLISQEPWVISRLAHRVAVMHAGKLFEIGPTETILQEPLHPFSRRFLGKEEEALPPEDDMVGRVYLGCPWVDHCPLAREACHRQSPELREVAPGHFVACHALEG